ncbi:hypothetical protein IFM46972_01214 [Aspergillus udagawae]|uniref:Uncharacterized protein n=1 Tax=Aspergillus udagawae TaxID=91492 RepID=A0A8H3N9Q9_9EURO|nr:hypothetical protein IFM46972_01214 [Aspergillus udagawae]
MSGTRRDTPSKSPWSVKVHLLDSKAVFAAAAASGNLSSWRDLIVASVLSSVFGRFRPIVRIMDISERMAGKRCGSVCDDKLNT